jgi:ACS family hexuronate transporter-like MFS transporter
MQEKSYRWLVLMLFTLCISAGSLGLNSIPSLGPLIKDIMNLSVAEVGALMASFYIGTTAMAFAYSVYFDRFSIKMSITLGLSLIGGFVLLAGLKLSFEWNMILLSIAGSGYGLMNPAINKAVVTWFPKNIRGTAMSIKQIGVMIGSGVSAAVLPVLAVRTSISFALVATGLVTVVVGILSYLLYKDKPVPVNREKLESSASGIKIIFSDKNLFLCNLIGILFVGPQFSFFMYLSFYMKEDFHYDVIQAGVILSFASIGGALGRIIWGIVSDFLFHSERKRILIFIGWTSTILGMLLAWIPAGVPVYFIYILVVFYGMTIGGWQGVFQAMVVELVEPRLAGKVSGISLSSIYLGTLVVPFLFGLLVEGTANFRLSWTVSAGCVLMASVLLMKVKTENKVKKAQHIAPDDKLSTLGEETHEKLKRHLFK